MSRSIAHQETSKLTPSRDTIVHLLGKLKQKLLIIARVTEDVKKLAAIICCQWECTIEHDSRNHSAGSLKISLPYDPATHSRVFNLEIWKNNALMFITALCIIIKTWKQLKFSLVS